MSDRVLEDKEIDILIRLYEMNREGIHFNTESKLCTPELLEEGYIYEDYIPVFHQKVIRLSEMGLEIAQAIEDYKKL